MAHQHHQHHSPCPSPKLHNPPISHTPDDAPRSRNLHQFLMPTKQHAHGLSAGLSITEVAAAHLGEPRRLRSLRARAVWCGCGGCGSVVRGRHAFVSVAKGTLVIRCLGASRRVEGLCRGVAFEDSRGQRPVAIEGRSYRKGNEVGANTYKYFIRTSSSSVPPSDSLSRFSIGGMSDCRIDWSISTTADPYVS